MGKSTFTYLLIGLILIGLSVGYGYRSQKLLKRQKPVPAETETYNPAIDPQNFVTQVSNRYFTLKPGTTFTYEQRSGKEVERTEVAVTSGVKAVMGVPTTVVWDRVWLNNVLIEDTKDWYAQDRDGNVWYFGETVDNYENGQLKDHAGSWEAGIDGALPGIIMKADPQVGDSYRQEYFAGQAEDMGDVVALDKQVTVPYGTFGNCLETRDWSRIESSTNEYKYYCQEAGFMVLEEAVADPQERTVLMTVSQ
jgi:hypothetical protein